MNRSALLGASVLVALLGATAAKLMIRARRAPSAAHRLVRATHPARLPIPHVDPGGRSAPGSHASRGCSVSTPSTPVAPVTCSQGIRPREPDLPRRRGYLHKPRFRPADGLLVFGSHDGLVYAAHPDTGRFAWRFATGDRIYSSPLVTLGGDVYVGSDADRFFHLSARGALDGGLATDDDADTSPALAPDGSIRFAAGRTLYSVDPDLTVRWRLDFGAKLFSSPAILADGTAVLGCQDDAVYAVDANGAVRWRYVTGSDVDAPPTVDAHGVVYVGSDDGKFYALDAGTGSVRWQQTLGGFVRAGAALGLDSTVVVGTYGPRPRIVGLRRSDGTQRWEIPIPGPPTEEFGVASAALVDREGRYAVGTPDGFPAADRSRRTSSTPGIRLHARRRGCSARSAQRRCPGRRLRRRRNVPARGRAVSRPAAFSETAVVRSAGIAYHLVVQVVGARRTIPRILSMILAGGEGKRLAPLTLERAKPAVPFGARYRIIDVVLSNFVNSGLHKIKVLTQYKSASLEEHVARRLASLGPSWTTTWRPNDPAQQRTGLSWFKAERRRGLAVRFHVIEDDGSRDRDHFSAAITSTRWTSSSCWTITLQKQADLTVAAIPVPTKDASSPLA